MKEQTNEQKQLGQYGMSGQSGQKGKNRKGSTKERIRKGILIPITVFCMALSMLWIPTTTAQAQWTILNVVDCNDWISLRTSPSTSADVITTIPLGEAVLYICDAGNGFYAVSYNGYVGYALACYLEAAAHATWQTKYVTNCNEWISLRTQPDTSASVLITIPLGAMVSTYVNYNPAHHNGFEKVSYNGYSGYALAEYLTAYAPMQVVNCNEWISLRTSPNTSASVITTIPLGAYVSYISTASNGFYKISYNGSEGYALSQFLSNATNTMYVTNCKEWISLRTSPNTSASVITTIPLGAAVTYISTASNGFYKVNYCGNVGYALASYLSY